MPTLATLAHRMSSKVGKVILLLASFLSLAIVALAFLGLFRFPLWLCVPLLAGFGFVVKKPFALAVPFALLAGLLIWRASLTAKNDRNWPADLKEVVTVAISGNQLTVRNYRYFDWMEEPARERWEERVFDLDQLSGVDLIIEPLPGSTLFAHAMLTFHFGESDHLCLSIEARKETGENYAIIPGALNQFELIHIIGSESDLLTLRSHVRGAENYRFPLKLSSKHQRALLDRFLDRTNELREEPDFYRSLTHNCTTGLVKEADALLRSEGKPSLGLRKETILPAQLPGLLHQRGLLDLPGDRAFKFEDHLTGPTDQEDA